MRRLAGMGLVAVLCVSCVANDVARAGGDESPSAVATRKKLQQKITIDAKEVGFKALIEDIRREMDKPFSFKIDNASGISNNSKVSYSCKDKTVDQVLSELADKLDFGWYVVSNPKDRDDGFIKIRKFKDNKERGYESGKEPKKTGQQELRRDPLALVQMRDEFFAAAWLQVKREPCRLRSVREEDTVE